MASTEPCGPQLESGEDLGRDQPLGVAGPASQHPVGGFAGRNMRWDTVEMGGEGDEGIAHPRDHVESSRRHLLTLHCEPSGFEGRGHGLADRPFLPSGGRDVDKGAKESNGIGERQGHG